MALVACVPHDRLHAQAAKPPITLDEFLNTTEITAARLSPDGKAAVIATENPDWKNNQFRHDLWLWTAETGLRPLTHSGSEETPEWSPDGKWIAFVSDRALPGQDAGDDGQPKNDADKASRALAHPGCGRRGAAALHAETGRALLRVVARQRLSLLLRDQPAYARAGRDTKSRMEGRDPLARAASRGPDAEAADRDRHHRDSLRSSTAEIRWQSPKTRRIPLPFCRRRGDDCPQQSLDRGNHAIPGREDDRLHHRTGA